MISQNDLDADHFRQRTMSSGRTLLRNRRSRLQGFVTLMICMTWIHVDATARADTPTPDQIEFFESKVRPILVEQCYACHSVQAEEIEAGLLLDSKWGWETGGDSGTAIVPGNLQESLLVQAIRYEEDLVSGMPPRSKLPSEQIDILERWVEMGAPDPRPKAIPNETASMIEPFDLPQRVDQHWSWKPIQHPTPPPVENETWPLQDLDRFVLAKLEQAGLQPAAPAGRRRWLRRVHFDLIGLPPSPEQIADFLADDSPEAYERVVARLIDSRHFGEKWARHWLDLVRYAETYGHEFDYPIPGASEYRDYVIRALNADVPYDQFVREHIAGDLLSDPRRNPEDGFNESILGTGFWYLHEATHAPTDVLGNEAGTINNQLDVFGKTFLGLTIACARCHDHKFDAISTADYYALSAYLQSSCRQVIDLDVHRARESASKQINQQLQAASARVASVLQDTQAWQQTLYTRFETQQLSLEAEPLRDLDPDAVFADFDTGELPSGWSTTGDAFQCVGSGLTLRTNGTAALPGTIDSAVGGKQQIGILRSPTFEITTENIHLRINSTAEITIHAVIDNYQMAPFSDLLFRGTLRQGKAADTEGEWKWISLNGDLKKYLGHRAYLEFIDSGNGSLAIDSILFSNDPVPQEPTPKLLDQESLRRSVNQAVIDVGAGRSNHFLASLLHLGKLSIRDLDPEAAELISATDDLAAQLPVPRFAVAMAQGTIEDAHIYIRGSHTNLGDPVPERFLQALGGKEGTRLELANQVASAQNPLTARVIVNRLWHHLMGRGIVSTVDDFGPQGQPPTHPELLDWLAQDLIDSNWSLKQTIASIVLSQTYRQDSVANPNLDPALIAGIDPNHALLYRMRVRRLPAESIRDAIFAVSGQLDLTSYGPSVPTHRTAFMSGRGARPSGPLDGNGRRSIYLSVYRNFLNPFMLAFDTPSPFGPQGRRSESNVPAQALTLMNDPMVIEQAQKWALQLAKQTEQDPLQMIGRMIEQTHGSEASVSQLEAMESFLNQQAAIHGQLDERVWADLAQALFNMKAFYFLQ